MKELSGQDIISAVLETHKDIPLRPYVIANELNDAMMYTIYKNGKRKHTIIDHEGDVYLIMYDSEGNPAK
jgi:hypothetical protein